MEDTPPTQSSSSTVAIRMPTPDWTQNAVNEVKAQLKTQGNILGNIDTIRIRKSLNRNEDDFVQAVINHCLSTVDRKLHNYIETHQKKISTLLTSIKDIVSLEVNLSKLQKDKMMAELCLAEKPFELDFYIYETDLQALDEWKKFGAMLKSKSDIISDVVTEQSDLYMLRISKRVHSELESALQTYAVKSQVKLSFKVHSPEYLGAMREYRPKALGMFLPNGTEGDYMVSGGRKEAYNEDVTNVYRFKKDKKVHTSLRQRTTKLKVHFQMEAFELPEAKEVMQHVKCSEKDVVKNAKPVVKMQNL